MQTGARMEEAARQNRQRKEVFADTISGWLTDFGKSGQVHHGNLADYLQKTDLQYLKTSFHSGKKDYHDFLPQKNRRRFPAGGNGNDPGERLLLGQPDAFPVFQEY